MEVNPQRMFLGSCSDEHSIGTILHGVNIRYSKNECWEIFNGQHGGWTECYDVVRVLPNGDVEYPDFNNY